MIDKIVLKNIDEHIRTIDSLRGSFADSIEQVGGMLSRSLADGGTVFWCGNGGSAADSQHLAAELVGRFKKDRSPLRSVALTTDSSVLTCVANDYCYEDIFARQIEALGRKGDVLVGFSTSGNSENILRALKMAKRLELVTVAFLGKGGGACANFADQALIVPSQDTARIQEAHILIGHIVCEMVETELGLV
ncbi:MAG TPA: D-sedoheptulose 7-phosphate isomerase [Burkholderiales bacterium]|nr:D-sedoheptulose 7-phosphate isomerase [Burkholderiales bacterium]